MKKNYFLLSILLLTTLYSCQQKQYANFQKSSSEVFERDNKLTKTNTISSSTEESSLSAVIIESIEKPISQNALVSAIDLPAVDFKTKPVVSFLTKNQTTVNSKVKTNKLTFKEKIATKVLEKQLTKAKTLKSNMVNTGWKGLDRALRLGIILLLSSIIIVWIPLIGPILALIAVLSGVILTVLGLVKTFA